MPSLTQIYSQATQSIRATVKTAIFFLKVFPMLPSGPVDWVTKPPVVDKVTYPTHRGQVQGDLYRPTALAAILFGTRTISGEHSLSEHEITKG